MADKYNAVVVGGGPSGSIAAKTLAAGGVKVLLVEKNFKRIKPCGGATPSRSFKEFAIPRNGKAPQKPYEKPGKYFFRSDRSIEQMISLHKRKQMQEAVLKIRFEKNMRPAGFLSYINFFRKFLN